MYSEDNKKGQLKVPRPKRSPAREIHLTKEQSEQLRSLLQQSATSEERSRYEMILLYHSGKSVKEIAATLQISSSFIYSHIKKFQEGGVLALHKKREKYVLPEQLQYQMKDALLHLTPGSTAWNQYKALLLLSEGYSITEVAGMLSLHIQSIYNYVKLHQAGKMFYSGIPDTPTKAFSKIRRFRGGSPFTLENKQQLGRILSSYNTSVGWVRYRAILMRSRGMHIDEIAYRLGCHSTTVQRYIALFNRGGWAALTFRKNTLSQKRLHEEQLQQLHDKVSTLPETSTAYLRYQIVLLYGSGTSIADICDLLHCSQCTAYLYIHRYISGGIEAIEELTLPPRRQHSFRCSNEQLEQLEQRLASLPQASSERLCYEAVRMYFSGQSAVDVAEALNCSVATVHSYARLFKNKGIEALPSPERASKTIHWTEQQLQQLEQAITEQSPADHGFAGKRYWTMDLIVQYVEREWGYRYSDRGIIGVLDRHGIQYTSPRRNKLGRLTHEQEQQIKQTLLHTTPTDAGLPHRKKWSPTVVVEYIQHKFGHSYSLGGAIQLTQRMGLQYKRIGGNYIVNPEER